MARTISLPSRSKRSGSLATPRISKNLANCWPISPGDSEILPPEADLSTDEVRIMKSRCSMACSTEPNDDVVSSSVFIESV